LSDNHLNENMKKVLLIALLFGAIGLCSSEAQAQAVLDRHAITAGFHNGESGAATVAANGSIGQAFSGTIAVPAGYIQTVGFHQPDRAHLNCPGDVNGDGHVSTLDILDILGWYGCMSGCGDYDQNDDNVVGAPDLLTVLGYYGQSCG
jgi:hypothetical protein